MPIKALEYYKNAISTIDKSTVDNKVVKRMLSWHKKNMEISFNGWMRLPPEMAKEDCEDN